MMMKIINPLLLLLLLMIIIKTMMIIMIKPRIMMKILMLSCCHISTIYENGNIINNLSSLAKLEYNLSNIPPIYNIHVILCPIILQHLE